MARDNFGQCYGCGQRILWIRTRAGKNMPVNPVLHNYKVEPGGREKIVTSSGDVVSGITGVPPEEATGVGYISHFATCTKAKNFRRKSG